MTEIKDKIQNWPRTKSGDPFFKTTEEAIFYATLIYDDPDFVNVINKCRQKTIRQIDQARKKDSPDIASLFILAFRNQFFRECQEEVVRLKNQAYQLNQGGPA